ncbi:putative nucleic acid-binding protein [Helianthus annuus]|nr:putative nucleic acid-binding protein [Helianthus annuus]
MYTLRCYIMENHNITMFRAVDAFQERFSVKVRVIRVWEHPERRNPSQLYSFDMILMDEEGTKMEATCLNRVLPQFRPSLVEKKCLIIRNPTIGFNNSTYRYVDNQGYVSRGQPKLFHVRILVDHRMVLIS